MSSCTPVTRSRPSTLACSPTESPGSPGRRTALDPHLVPGRPPPGTTLTSSAPSPPRPAGTQAREQLLERQDSPFTYGPLTLQTRTDRSRVRATPDKRTEPCTLGISGLTTLGRHDRAPGPYATPHRVLDLPCTGGRPRLLGRLLVARPRTAPSPAHQETRLRRRHDPASHAL